MPSKLKLSLLSLTIATATLLAIPAFAQESSPYGRGYGDGYDDGYEDGMDDCPCPPFRFHPGFYLGAEGGYSNYSFDRRLDLIDLNLRTANQISANGFMGALFLGYAFYYYHWYLGTELFLARSSANQSYQTNVGSPRYNSNISIGSSYGVTVKPGYRLEKGPLFYMNLGYTQAQIKTDESVFNGGNSLITGMNNWRGGYLYGLGAELPLPYKNLNVRFEYDRINYSDITNNLMGTSSTPHENRTTLGLIYRF